MIANALFIAISVLSALGFWLMSELKFLVPYKAVLLDEYSRFILLYVSLLFLNLFAATLTLIRKFFLKDTGRKLFHVDRQFHLGETEVPAPWFEEQSN